MSGDDTMGQRDDEILATLQKMLANQEAALAVQQTALAAQQKALANQEKAIAQQKLSIAKQLGHIKLYRVVLMVGVPLVALLVYIFFRIAGPYL
jgi:ABC-type Fe3+ transport system permease subunit